MAKKVYRFFPFITVFKADLATDQFQVVKLILEALQYLRIKYRLEEIEKENQAIKTAKEKLGQTHEIYFSFKFDNEDTPK